MKTLDYYLGLLAQSTRGVDIHGSLLYGLIAFALAMVVTAVIAGMDR